MRKAGKRGPSAGGSTGSKRSKTDSVDYSGRWDDEVHSSESDEGGSESEDVEDSEEEETAEEKRRRLAKDYLRGMVGNGDESADSEDDESEGENHAEVSSKLRRERLEASGKYFQDLAGSLSNHIDEDDNEAFEDSLSRITLGAHKLPVTCVALSNDEQHVYSGSKDNSVVMWDTETGSKLQTLKAPWRRDTHGDAQAHQGETLAVAVTSDGKYAVSGGRDKMLRIYDVRQGRAGADAGAEIKCFSGHRDAITSLAFRKDSKSLFSGSLDRCLKHWDLNEMGYLETLFGHQDGVTAVDCWTKEKPVSASMDRTWRLWKVVEESHLVFRGDKGSLDAIQLMTEDSFVTGGQDGALSLWKETQKKPIRTAHRAHGGGEAGSAGVANWISSLASVKMSNLVASGANDGFVRLWNASSEHRELEQLAAIKVDGFVNAMAMSPRLLVAGCGREPRLGRWWNLTGNKNKVHIIRFRSDLSLEGGAAAANDDEDDDDDDEAGSSGSEEDSSGGGSADNDDDDDDE